LKTRYALSLEGEWLKVATGDVVPSIDWFTGTSDDTPNAFSQTVYGRHLLSEEQAKGNPRQPWGHHGFIGYHCGRVDFGERQGELILRVQSALADDCWKPATDLGFRASRIDVAVTVWTGDSSTDVGRKARDDAREYQHGRRNPIKVDYYDPDGGNGTCYLGRWTSSRFARIYSRHGKTHLDSDVGCWRYEVVEKDEGARRVVEHLSGAVDVRAECRSLVHTFIRDRGSIPIFDAGGPSLSLACSLEPTDDDKRLQWLGEQVAPSIRELIDRRGLSVVANALGIEGDIWYNWGARSTDRPPARWVPKLEEPFWPRKLAPTPDGAVSH
jgi:hypothetical protein